MVTKKSDLTKKEKPTASRKKKTAEIVEEAAHGSGELNQSPVPEDQPQENEIIQPMLPPASLVVANSASSVTSGLIASAITLESTSTATGKTTKKKKESIGQRDERFDLNMILLAGIIHSVWGSGSDVFARLGLSTRGQLVEEDDQFTTYVTLRFADGMVSGQPITIQKGSILKVRGYLTHREYSETLRKFLDDARASSFFELVPHDDLGSWRSISFPRHNGVMNVLEMMILDQDGKPIERLGFEEELTTSAADNRASVEGVVARLWEYPHAHGVDIFMRLAVYDLHTPIDPKREGNFGRARRSAHYITVRFPNGKTASGSTVRLRAKMRVRVNGELRDKAQVVTLREELLKTGNPAIIEMMGRVQNAERMNEIQSQQESLHILANAVVVYSMAGGSR